MKSPAVLKVKLALDPLACGPLLKVHWKDVGLPELVLWNVAGWPIQAFVKSNDVTGVAMMLMVFSAVAVHPLLAVTERLT